MTADATPATSPPTFDAIPLSAELRRAIDACGYTHPTPVQLAVFEPAIRGKNLVVQARTGTGKTAAFGMPILDVLVKKSLPKVQALILTPTRELALQITRELEKLAQFRGTKLACIYGGAPMGKQIEALEGGAQVVAGTPGRVLDHLRRGTLDPSNVKIFVLDEADEMLSMGFAKELHAIAERLPKERQGLFFSATIPPDIERLAQSQLKEPEFITLSSDQIGALQIQHFVYVLRGGDKRGQIVRILEIEDPESAIIFCNTKSETEALAEALQRAGYDADWLNGDLEQSSRERVMQATREGKLRFLVATDVAARGIDISHLTHVINADFPESAEAYVHRTGRTGRAGKTGTAISIVGPKDIGNLYILRLTYKIRPIERQIPTAGELKTRAEADLVQVFVDAFAARPSDPADLALARRLLTHADAERIVGALLRDHLGAHVEAGGEKDAASEAAAARRARNPPAIREEKAPEEKPRAARHREDRPREERPREERRARDERPRDDRPREERPRDDRPREERPRDDRSREDRPREERKPREDRRPTGDSMPPTRAEGHRADAPPRERPAPEPLPVVGYTESDVGSPQPPPPPRREERARRDVREGRDDRGPRRDARDDRAPRRDAPRVGVPHKSFATWEPPIEADDDKPLLAASDAPAAPDTARGEAREAREMRESGERDVERDDPDFAQIFLNVGRRDGARAADFQKVLQEGAGLPPEDTGRIRVRDRNTFVSVRKVSFDKALAAFAGQTIAGRSVVAEPAKQRLS